MASTRKLKTYRWVQMLKGGQYEMIVAAHSKAEVARIAGYDRPDQLWNLGETGNKDDIETATAKPGQIFYARLNDYSAKLQPFPSKEQMDRRRRR